MLLNPKDIERLVLWFRENRRTMAWRSDPTPYHVWISEIMLQQTRVETVHAYYASFLNAFPDVRALSEADDDSLYKQWEGLGYYSRARNLRKASGMIVSRYGGRVPDTYEELIRLPGIGVYTAGAILSIAYHQPVPVVDGNVLRVLMRFTGDQRDVRDPETARFLRDELSKTLPGLDEDPSEVNQGLMELGALVCVPNGAPKCGVCPWKDHCQANLTGRTDQLPVVSPKPGKKVEKKTVFLVSSGGRTALTKREGKGVLRGLYGLPMADGHLSAEEAEELFKSPAVPLPEQKHVFTHIVWEMKAYRIETDRLPDCFGQNVRWVTEEELTNTEALPSAFKKWPLF